MRVCKADLVHLSPRSNGVRKSIARVLTVINQKQRQNVRELYKSKNAKCECIVVVTIAETRSS